MSSNLIIRNFVFRSSKNSFCEINRSFILFLLMSKYFFLLSKNFCDAPESWQMGFQDPATPLVEGMHGFHNYLMLFLIVIGVAVCFILAVVVFKFNALNKKGIEKFTHSSFLEIIWTLLPSIVLLFLATPSFSLLYSLDELINPKITLKAVGHQWYWSYEYSDFCEFANGESLAFDSYMLNVEDMKRGKFRLLEVDNRVFLPSKIHIRLLITSADVLHSWAIPSFGIKVDACPGRLSQASLFLKRNGTYYGQCSEICGVNHGFMPIVVKGVSTDAFTSWVFKKLDNLQIEED